VELLMTGTASFHPQLSGGPVGPDQVVTSELSGVELWTLAKLGYQPKQIVMATSVYSLGVAAGIGALFQSVKRGELPEVTKMIYEARENCLELVRREADALGAERVMSTRLEIREIGQGLVEIVAIGTAVVPAAPSMQPQTPQLLPQALVADGDHDDSIETLGFATAPMQMVRGGAGAAGQQALGCVIALLVMVMTLCCLSAPALLELFSQK
jgi:uncharacterized protein YbjQ (UPF0145 family)